MKTRFIRMIQAGSDTSTLVAIEAISHVEPHPKGPGSMVHMKSGAKLPVTEDYSSLAQRIIDAGKAD